MHYTRCLRKRRTTWYFLFFAIVIGEEQRIQYADDTNVLIDNILSNYVERLEIQGFECVNACTQYFEHLILKTNYRY